MTGDATSAGDTTVKKRRGAPVIDRVLDLSLEAIAREGMDGLSIPEIARLAGLNKTSLYRRWPTREALVAAALERAMGHEEEAPDTGTLRGDLVALIERAANWTGSPAGTGVLRALLSAPGPGEIMSRMLAGRARAPETVLKRAVQRGELPLDTDVRLVLTVIAGACLQRLMIEQTPISRGFIEDLVTLLLSGMKR